MNNNKKFSAIRQAGLIACVLLGAAIAAQAQPASPEGVWDFRISGSQRGVAFVTFNKDNTLNGWEIVTHRPHSTGSSNPRGGTNSTPSTSTESFFGYTPLSGNWNQLANGRVVGFFAETDGSSNALGSQFSFTGRVGAGTNSLVLSGLESPNPTPLGFRPRRVTMAGVPFVTATDISGNWYAQGTVSGSGASRETFTEFFTLDNMAAVAGTVPADFTDIASSPVGVNAYLVTGTGPRYTNFGVALLSGKKRLGLVVREGDLATTQTILRAVEGPINTNKSTATLLGTDDNVSSVTFHMRKFPTVPPAP